MPMMRLVTVYAALADDIWVRGLFNLGKFCSEKEWNSMYGPAIRRCASHRGVGGRAGARLGGGQRASARAFHPRSGDREPGVGRRGQPTPAQPTVKQSMGCSIPVSLLFNLL